MKRKQKIEAELQSLYYRIGMVAGAVDLSSQKDLLKIGDDLYSLKARIEGLPDTENLPDGMEINFGKDAVYVTYAGATNEIPYHLLKSQLK